MRKPFLLVLLLAGLIGLAAPAEADGRQGHHGTHVKPSIELMPGRKLEQRHFGHHRSGWLGKGQHHQWQHHRIPPWHQDRRALPRPLPVAPWHYQRDRHWLPPHRVPYAHRHRHVPVIARPWPPGHVEWRHRLVILPHD